MLYLRVAMSSLWKNVAEVTNHFEINDATLLLALRDLTLSLVTSDRADFWYDVTLRHLDTVLDRRTSHTKMTGSRGKVVLCLGYGRPSQHLLGFCLYVLRLKYVCTFGFYTFFVVHVTGLQTTTTKTANDRRLHHCVIILVLFALIFDYFP